jgi:hypothetical protein
MTYMGRRSNKRLRIRTKRLDQLDETKLALALWLLAKDVLADEQSSDTRVAFPELPPDEDDAEAA